MSAVAAALTGLRVDAVIYLSAPQPGDYDPTASKGPEWGKAAPVALLIILLMAISLYFLIRSMGKQLKKVPPSFDPEEVSVSAAAGSGGTAGSDNAAATAASAVITGAVKSGSKPHPKSKKK